MRFHNATKEVFIREIRALLEKALRKLWRKHPQWARAFKLRVMQGLERDEVARRMGQKRKATISEWVRNAQAFLRSELPPLCDLV